MGATLNIMFRAFPERALAKVDCIGWQAIIGSDADLSRLDAYHPRFAARRAIMSRPFAPCLDVRGMRTGPYAALND